MLFAFLVAHQRICDFVFHFLSFFFIFHFEGSFIIYLLSYTKIYLYKEKYVIMWKRGLQILMDLYLLDVPEFEKHVFREIFRCMCVWMYVRMYVCEHTQLEFDSCITEVTQEFVDEILQIFHDSLFHYWIHWTFATDFSSYTMY
jgi:hypothetical protein